MKTLLYSAGITLDHKSSLVVMIRECQLEARPLFGSTVRFAHVLSLVCSRVFHGEVFAAARFGPQAAQSSTWTSSQ